MLWQLLAAPPAGMIDIVIPKAIKVYDPILNAFMEVESNFRTGVINNLGYTGILQIGQEMTDEANRINELSGNPLRFKFPECALDSLQSVQIWYIVQDWHNPTYNLRRAAYIWNPLASVKYYLKIKKSYGRKV